MCRQEKKGRRGIRVIYEMRPADFYTAYNGFTRVTGTLGRSRFPRLRQGYYYSQGGNTEISIFSPQTSVSKLQNTLNDLYTRKENLGCFLSFGFKDAHQGIILVQGLFCHPLITAHDQSSGETSRHVCTCVMFCARYDDPVFMGSTLIRVIKYT